MYENRPGIAVNPADLVIDPASGVMLTTGRTSVLVGPIGPAMTDAQYQAEFSAVRGKIVQYIVLVAVGIWLLKRK